MNKNQMRIIWIIATINLMILSSTRLVIADSASPSTAGAATRMGSKKALPLETEFAFTGGYRRDDLDWNIAGDINGNNPNILSELTWDDIESYQVKFQGSLVWPIQRASNMIPTATATSSGQGSTSCSINTGP